MHGVLDDPVNVRRFAAQPGSGSGIRLKDICEDSGLSSVSFVNRLTCIADVPLVPDACRIPSTDRFHLPPTHILATARADARIGHRSRPVDLERGGIAVTGHLGRAKPERARTYLHAPPLAAVGLDPALRIAPVGPESRTPLALAMFNS